MLAIVIYDNRYDSPWHYFMLSHYCYSLSFIAYNFLHAFQVASPGGHRAKIRGRLTCGPRAYVMLLCYVGLDPYPLYKIILSIEGLVEPL